jgi:hypothetical protein
MDDRASTINAHQIVWILVKDSYMRWSLLKCDIFTALTAKRSSTNFFILTLFVTSAASALRCYL